MASNNPQNTFNQGDILSVLSGDISVIRRNSTDILDNTDILKKDVSDILRQSPRWSQQNARSRIEDTVNRRNQDFRNIRQNNNDNRNATNSNLQSRSRISTRHSTEGFIDSFFGELERDILGSNFKSSVQQSMKDLASALGVQVDEIPALFGRTLAQSFKKTDIGKKITERLQNSMDNSINRSLDRMRRGINRNLDRRVNSGDISANDADHQREQWSRVMDRIENNLQNRRTDVTNDPTPRQGESLGDNNTQNSSNNNSNVSELNITSILDDKLDYLYPINNTLGVINTGVSIIADYLTKDDSSMSQIMDIFHQTSDQMSEENNNFIENILNSGLGGSNTPSNLGDLAGNLLNNPEITDIISQLFMSEGALGAGEALAGLAAAAGPVIVAFLAMQAANMIIKKFLACFEPLTESFKELKKTFDTVGKRYWESERKKIKDQTDRLQKDVEVMIKTPFDIMNQAAEEWYSTWDNNLKTINATQGYTKADLQNLMSSYADRLRSENLSNVVSATEISSNLTKVLEAGLSGQAAEEFAYLATVLNNAIPTQEFFNYASTYASIVANQVSLGKSQSEAIQSANDQLEQFASNLLYSSRELAGGFSTGLNDAASLLDNAVKIANTAGVGDSSMISSVLTAVASTVGAIAPDLASNITDAIVDAALGGNTDELVALRSQAGTGAANTSFLNSFARNPQKVIETLFNNLSRLQNMNTDNFMEVAESLASTFGLSIGAFTRINFNTIAEAVSNMNINLNALQSNIRLLQEGETTTTAEQLKMQQINEMILNEGLSYVLDNAAAREIQQHMWSQELAAQMQEAEYSVELTGKSLEFLSSIKETIDNILNIIDPRRWFKGVKSIIDTYSESFDLRADIKEMLEAGKVGQGNANSLYNLTTYDVDRLTNNPENLLEMMGRQSAYSTSSSLHAAQRAAVNYGSGTKLTGNKLIGPLGTGSFAIWGLNKLDSLITGISNSLSGGSYGDSDVTDVQSSDRISKYNWGFISKGISNAINSSLVSTKAYIPGSVNTNTTVISDTTEDSTQHQITNKNIDKIQDYFNTMESYIEDNKSFEDWVASSINYNISDLDTAIKQYGITMEELKGKYQEYESVKGSEYNYSKDEKEEEFWNRVKLFLDEDIPIMFEEVKTKMDRQIELLENIDLILTYFLGSWTTDWLQTAWNENWLNQAWRTEWIEQAWRNEWIKEAWGNGWISSWKDEWINNAWKSEWIEKAWNENWLNQAWNNGWINKSWNTDWLQNAWGLNWLTESWQSAWLDKAWNTDWLQNAWSLEWLDKAWNQSWLNQSWGIDWLQNAWNTTWIAKSWNQSWLKQAWNQSWLKEAWGLNWLKEAWNTDWITKAWNTDWLIENWGNKWITKAWRVSWLKEAWKDEWKTKTFKEYFVNKTIKALWGNRWYEFFNIFKDRFGGITTENTETGKSGKQVIDLSNLYKIYSHETSDAAVHALKDVKNEEKSETGDAVLALAKQLTKNSIEEGLKDPQVQTNVLLSQILIVLEAIMQAENVSGGASLATTLAALGLGTVTPNTSIAGVGARNSIAGVGSRNSISKT